jgi:hypothetical protein
MSVGGVAFWASDYAYEIMSAKRTSLPMRNLFQETDDDVPVQEEFTGLKQRVDEYIPAFKKQENPEDKKVEKGGADERYSEEEQKMINDLKSRDQEVRTHEQAHISAGGAHVRGGASYTYQSGPDGIQYAIGGEVSIDTSPVKGSPEATIAKMQAVQAAALAPASPSGQDRAVASAASKIETQARTEVSEKSDPQNNPQDETPTVKINNQINSAILAYMSTNVHPFVPKINIAV